MTVMKLPRCTPEMEPLKLLVFVGTEGVYHDPVGNGKFITVRLSKTEDIRADSLGEGPAEFHRAGRQILWALRGGGIVPGGQGVSRHTQWIHCG
jgi:hypothetical protein